MATLTTLDKIEQNGVLVTLGGTQGPPGARGDHPQTPISIDVNDIEMDCTDSAYFRINLNADIVNLPTPINPVDGQRAIIEFVQDGVGGHTYTLDAAYNQNQFVVAGGGTPNSIDIMGICYNEPRDEWLVLAFSRGY